MLSTFVDLRVPQVVPAHAEPAEFSLEHAEISLEHAEICGIIWCQEPLLGPTSTRAGGQDDGSYTNSLKLHTLT